MKSVSGSWVSGPVGTLWVSDGGGEGPPVVLVHSLAGCSTHWDRQLEHLGPKHRAVALDLRGHGQSEPPRNSDYSIAAMAGDIAAAADALGLDRFVLVGHSMGGGVALNYAGVHPDRVAGLLLVDPIGDGKQIPATESQSFLNGLESDYPTMIRQYWTSIVGPNSAVRERLLGDLGAVTKDTLLQSLRSVMQFDPDPLLARYPGPIMAVVTPQNDAGFSLHRLGRGFPHRVVTGTGHWIQLDQPEEFNRLLDEFLSTKSVSGKDKPER